MSRCPNGDGSMRIFADEQLAGLLSRRGCESSGYGWILIHAELAGQQDSKKMTAAVLKSSTCYLDKFESQVVERKMHGGGIHMLEGRIC